MKRFIFRACLGMLSLTGFAADQTPDHAKELAKRLKQFQKGMKATSVEDKKKAFRALLCTKADVKALFPKNADSVWEDLQAYEKDAIKNIDEMARDITSHDWVTIQAIDMRDGNPSDGLAKVLKIIPKDVPVYRAVMKGKGFSSGVDAFLFVNGRWVFIDGLRQIPAIIAEGEKKK